VGQKVNPNGLRLGIIRNWDARWFAERDFSDLLLEDIKIRKYIKQKCYAAGVSRIEIERVAKRVQITIHTAKPGIIIGRGGAGVEALRKDLEKMTGKQVHVNIQEIKVPELDAQLVAEGIAQQLEKRTSFRRAMKQAMARTMRAGAKGIRVAVSGRLGGAEIARTEGYREGTVPLQTLRADIEYGFAEAHTTYGRIGVKVWIYKGEVLPAKQARAEQKEVAAEGGE
jgi:small subunit ribosomal protein S3